MRRRYFLIPTILSLLCLSGCWSRNEVNDIAIVTATGLDLTEDGQIRLSLLLAVPRLIGTGSAQGTSESKLSTSAGWVVSEAGEDIMDSYRRLQEKLPRHIFFAHSRLLIIGKQLAEQDIGQLLDFFERYRQSQLKSYLVISKTTAADILNFKSKFEKLPSEVLREEMKMGLSPSVRVVDFLNSLSSEGDEPFAPIVQLVESEKEKPGLKNLALSGLAVFRGSRMVGSLSSTEGRGVMWMRNLVREGVITIHVTNGTRKGTISAELEHVKVRRLVRINGDQVAIKLTIEVTENIFENNSTLDLREMRNLEMVQKMMENDIKDRIQLAKRLLQETYKSDVLGFGQSLSRMKPRAWNQRFRKRWETEFPNVEVTTSIRVNVLRTGLTNRTLMPKE